MGEVWVGGELLTCTIPRHWAQIEGVGSDCTLTRVLARTELDGNYCRLRLQIGSTLQQRRKATHVRLNLRMMGGMVKAEMRQRAGYTHTSTLRNDESTSSTRATGRHFEGELCL